jgi:hypothetical protein
MALFIIKPPDASLQCSSIINWKHENIPFSEYVFHCDVGVSGKTLRHRELELLFLLRGELKGMEFQMSNQNEISTWLLSQNKIYNFLEL